MKKNRFYKHFLGMFLVFIFLFSASSCSDDEVESIVGDILIEVKREGGLEGVGYKIYSEAYLSANSSFPPLLSGNINGGRIEVKGVNPGNYILELEAGHNWRVFLQATAGQERKFVIE